MVRGMMIASQDPVNQLMRLRNGADVGCWSMVGGPPDVEAAVGAW